MPEKLYLCVLQPECRLNSVSIDVKSFKNVGSKQSIESDSRLVEIIERFAEDEGNLLSF
jgi:hypothetical protein